MASSNARRVVELAGGVGGAKLGEGLPGGGGVRLKYSNPIYVDDVAAAVVTCATAGPPGAAETSHVRADVQAQALPIPCANRAPA